MWWYLVETYYTFVKKPGSSYRRGQYISALKMYELGTGMSREDIQNDLKETLKKHEADEIVIKELVEEFALCVD